MVINSSATALPAPTGTWAPPTQLRDRPAAVTCRAINNSSPSTSPPNSSTWAVVAASGLVKTPSTRAWSAPSRTALGSERAPSSRPIPVTIMVLPAPVSPVTAVRPGSSSIVAELITPRLVIRSSLIMVLMTSVRRRRRASLRPAARTC